MKEMCYHVEYCLLVFISILSVFIEVEVERHICIILIVVIFLCCIMMMLVVMNNNSNVHVYSLFRRLFIKLYDQVILPQV